MASNYSFPHVNPTQIDDPLKSMPPVLPIVKTRKPRTLKVQSDNHDDFFHVNPTQIDDPLKSMTPVVSIAKTRKQSDPTVRRLNLSEKLSKLTAELTERNKQYNLLVEKPREVAPSTMLIHVYIDAEHRDNYRVFCDTTVAAVLDDIRLRHTFSGICADMFHETRILLPDNMVCAQLKNIFVLDANGDVTIHFSTGTDLIMF